LETGNKYKYTKAYFKLLRLILDNPDENVFVVRGGQGASKTISILQLIIQALLNSEKEATVLSSELSKMKRTVIRDYKKICKDWGIITTDEFNKSESKHEYPNDSYMDFLGADVTDLGKGFRRDILYINEANKMDMETANQFISRAALTIIDFNPDELFWGDELINEKNFITLTFEDNEYLAESEVKAILGYKEKGFKNPDIPFDELFKPENILSKYWANKWRVYGLGLTGALEGVIFDNWKECSEIPKDATFISYGLDFGFTNDPTALVGVWKQNGELYVKEFIYKTRLTNSDISAKLRTIPINFEEIVCDSAEPKSIEDLSRFGFNVEGAKKGPDSVKNSIDTLQQYKLNITSDSTNLIKELKTYKWKSDKTGAAQNEPVDLNNHAIDALRYVALNKINKDDSIEFY
jgi:phage terminase large subunit